MAPKTATKAKETATPKSATKFLKKPVSSSSSDSSSSDDDEPVSKKIKQQPVKPVATNNAKATNNNVNSTTAQAQAQQKVAPSPKHNATPKPISPNKFPKRAASSSSSSSDSSDDEKPAPKVNKQPPAPQPKVVPPSPKVAPVSTPKHQPVVNQTQSPKREQPVSVPKATPNPIKRPFGSQTPVTASGDETYTETKKTVANMFGSSCPHCGHEIEVKVKFS